MDLTESEYIKKRLKEYIEMYKRNINDLDNYEGVITHVELAWDAHRMGLYKHH